LGLDAVRLCPGLFSSSSAANARLAGLVRGLLPAENPPSRL
jgi:hypothetical protein